MAVQDVANFRDNYDARGHRRQARTLSPPGVHGPDLLRGGADQHGGGMAAVYIAAVRGELGESLTVSDLALLRASSFSGHDQALFETLLRDMQGRIAAGILACDVVEVEEPTGRWLTVRPWDPRRDSPLSRGQPVREVWDSKPTHRSNAIRETRLRSEQRVTKSQAQTLFKVDSTHWSEGACHWAEIEVSASTGNSNQFLEVASCTPTEPAADSVAERYREITAMPFQYFKRIYQPMYRGSASLDSLRKNRSREDQRSTPPYALAFNTDGTVNVYQFVKIALSRAEWNEGGTANELTLAWSKPV